MDNIDQIIEDYDLEAAGNAFARHVLKGGNEGSFFRDGKGLKWKYLRFITESEEHIASHGEFCIVAKFIHQGGTRYTVETELKQRSAL